MGFVVGFEGLPGVGKTSAILETAARLDSLGYSVVVIPELVVTIGQPPFDPDVFVRNDAIKERTIERAVAKQKTIVLADRTWVSTNACNIALLELGFIPGRMSHHFAVDMWVFYDEASSPHSLATFADWPWSMPRFAAVWETAALDLISKAGGPRVGLRDIDTLACAVLARSASKVR